MFQCHIDSRTSGEGKAGERRFINKEQLMQYPQPN
jgi:hypothetical protein